MAGPHGAVAVCTQLTELPGPAVQRLRGADDYEAALNEIDRARPTDALVAIELVQALERGSVYLVSRLDESLVEELGILPLAAGELPRLVSRFDSCIVLANAQYAIAHPQRSTPDESRPRRPRAPR